MFLKIFINNPEAMENKTNKYLEIDKYNQKILG
jgi:hypothetical protein